MMQLVSPNAQAQRAARRRAAARTAARQLRMAGLVQRDRAEEGEAAGVRRLVRCAATTILL